MPLAFGSGRNAAVTAGSSGDQELSYRIGRSLRFNSADSAYLNRTMTASFTSQRIFTFSFWCKRGSLSSAQSIFDRNQSTNVNQFAVGFNSNDTFAIAARTSGTSTIALNLATSAVFRDPSAWYHFVIAVDNTQTTLADRGKIYVNGVLQSLGTQTATQNVDYHLLSGLTYDIGRTALTSSQYFDGYLTEFNFIDGQALTPSSFGETDAITGRWKAKGYSGTYGTNGFYLPFSNNSSTTTQNLLTYSEDFANAAWINYESTDTSNASTAPNGTTTADKLIPNVGSAGGQFYRTYTATDNTTYTFSTYAKPDGFSRVRLYIQKKAATYAYADYDLSTGTIETTVGSPSATTITSVGNGWYRISISTDVGTGGTSTPTVNIQHLGTVGNGSNGLLIWGAQLEANGTVGPYLYTGASTISSSLRVAQDMSISTGGYNSWVTNNLSVTAGAGNDSLVDSPTNYGTDTGVGGEVRGNYPTWNQLDINGTVTITNGNLDASASGTCRSTIPFPTYGKWYCECTANSSSPTTYGVGIILNTSKSILTSSFTYRQNGQKSIDGGGGLAYGSSYTTNDIIGIAYDSDAGTVTMYKNNVSQGVLGSSLTGEYAVCISGGGGGSTQMSVNFGQRPFAYTAPTGFKALCTTNLSIPTIQKPSKYMDVVTYTGNGTSRSITGLGFSPDLVWIKSRTNAYSHRLADTVRGAGKELFSNETSAETTNDASGYVSAFNSDGFTIGTGLGVNNSGSTFVAWAWDEAPIAGMDIVSYTGNGTNRTIAHNLGVAPKMMIVKNRLYAGAWRVYHQSIGNTKNLRLNLTNAEAVDSTIWNNTSPTSSDFAIGTDADVNRNNDTHIAYLFAEVEGFSKFGSYTGNGSTDGPFIYLGFRPKLIIVKGLGVNFWLIKDTARSTFNGTDYELYPHLGNAEGTYSSPPPMDYLSNGIKIRTTAGETNTSSTTYIYAAFAESPFKYARAR